MNARRIPVLVAAVGLTLAACGGSDGDSAPNDDAAAPETVAASADDPTDTVSASAEPTDDPEPSDSDAAAEPETEADGDAPTSDVVATEAPTGDGGAEPVATEAPAAEAAAPEVGGRVLATEVDPASQFDGNPFPDLVVEDVGRGGQANLANLLPADRPLLLWAWAPH
ncbi:hypothetical protein [Ilumatobacter nonamiensis]|uniref:hypothetical protein n=1 Tax=Ilumatobacter nonamiensis TaxID=467093 RepID=UPI000347B2CD|nr:hypothetical protein [Ilumatobacter nonamiensis]